MLGATVKSEKKRRHLIVRYRPIRSAIADVGLPPVALMRDLPEHASDWCKHKGVENSFEFPRWSLP